MAWGVMPRYIARVAVTLKVRVKHGTKVGDAMRKGKRERLADKERKRIDSLNCDAWAKRAGKVIACAHNPKFTSAMRFDPLQPVGRTRPNWAYLSPVRGMRAGAKR